MSCSICVERFNKSTHAPVKCPTCQAVACSSCTETYLLSGSQDPHCMSCRVGWTREVLDSCGLTKKFVTQTYKTHRENVLFERERALMPATQPHVERALKIRRLEQESAQIEALRLKKSQEGLTVQTGSLEVLAAELGTDDYLELGMVRIERAYKIYAEMSILKNQIDMINSKIYHLRTSGVDEKKEARKFIRACPANGCSGFLSHVWKCGVCEKWSCPDCHDVIGNKDDPHTCKTECIETAKMLSKDSKPCPKCASFIFKIDGCDQMWCPQCSTAFSWRTGKVEVGRIHNPHYYEYQRGRGAIPREIGDIPCGGMPQDFRLIQRIEGESNKRLITGIMRYHTHIEMVILPGYRHPHQDNMDLRMKYMMKDMPEATFKQKVQQRDKKVQKCTEIANILNTYQVVTAEIVQRMMLFQTQDQVNEMINEIFEIARYINELMTKVSSRYSCVTPRITLSPVSVTLQKN